MSGTATLLGPDGSPIPAAPRQSVPVRRVMGRGFAGASRSDPDLAMWTPSLDSAHGALKDDRALLASRIHDLARNDGWASGGITRVVDNIIGAGWRLSHKPNASVLGISPDAAVEFASQVEAAWADYAEDPDCFVDAGLRTTFGGLLALAFRHRLLDGEAAAVIHWIPGRGPYSTAVEIVDPDRLSNPPRFPETARFKSGIELGGYGEPLAYHVSREHPNELLAEFGGMRQWIRFPRATSFGRRIFVHSFEADRAGQIRGIPLLAPVVKKLRMLGRYDEAELQAAVLNAVLAAFVESPFDHEQFAQALGGGDETISRYQQERLDFYQAAPLSLPGAKIAFTFPGEKVNLTTPNHPNSVFEAFNRASLRNIAAALGMSYEQLSMDWSQSNYSSARGALLEVWRGFAARKAHFEATFAAPIFAAWLEEAIDLGKVKLPDGAPEFYAAKAAYCRARWIGPGRGWVDPLKEAQAAVARLTAGISTLEKEVAEQGDDYREVLAQIARERKEKEAFGLDPDVAPDGARPPPEPDPAPAPAGGSE